MNNKTKLIIFTAVGCLALGGISTLAATELFTENLEALAEKVYNQSWTKAPTKVGKHLVLKTNLNNDINVALTNPAETQKGVASLKQNGTFEVVRTENVPGIGHIQSINVEYTVGNSETAYDIKNGNILKITLGFNNEDGLGMHWAETMDLGNTIEFAAGHMPSYFKITNNNGEVVNITKLTINYGCTAHDFDYPLLTLKDATFADGTNSKRFVPGTVVPDIKVNVPMGKKVAGWANTLDDQDFYRAWQTSTQWASDVVDDYLTTDKSKTITPVFDVVEYANARPDAPAGKSDLFGKLAEGKLQMIGLNAKSPDHSINGTPTLVANKFKLTKAPYVTNVDGEIGSRFQGEFSTGRDKKIIMTTPFQVVLNQKYTIKITIHNYADDTKLKLGIAESSKAAPIARVPNQVSIAKDGSATFTLTFTYKTVTPANQKQGDTTIANDNILLVFQHDVNVPKLLDFGIKGTIALAQ